MIQRLIDRYIARRRWGYPLERTDTLIFPLDYKGLVVTSDIDKTYLQTPFSSLRDLVRVALESAEEKKSFQGMAPLYHGLRKGLSPNDPARPLYFVSASPPPMRGVLMKKMEIDGIETDGITLKHWFRLLRHGRWEQLRQHIIYKLNALLINRSVRPVSADIDEILIGDDSETDTAAYLLYTEILHGIIGLPELEQKLEELEATAQEQDHILQLAQRKDNCRVVRIYIHCTTKREPTLLPPGPPEILLGALDSLQIAVDAYFHGWVSLDTVTAVGNEFTPEQRKESIANLAGRNIITHEQAASLLL